MATHVHRNVEHTNEMEDKAGGKFHADCGAVPQARFARAAVKSLWEWAISVGLCQGDLF